jgi:hypothetical protein
MSISPEQRKVLSQAISNIELNAGAHLVGSQGLRITRITDDGDEYRYKRKIVEREWHEVVSERYETLSKERVHKYIRNHSEKFEDKNWTPPEKEVV